MWVKGKEVHIPALAMTTEQVRHVINLDLSSGACGAALDGVRLRIGNTWLLPSVVGIAFAGSGIGLEYVGPVTANRGEAKIPNARHGSNEVGS